MDFNLIVQEIKKQLNYSFNIVDYDNGNIVVVFEKKLQILPFIKIDKLNNCVQFAFFNTYRIDEDLIVDSNYFIMVFNMEDNNVFSFILNVNNYLKNLYNNKWIDANYYNIFVYGTLKRGYRNSYLTFNSIRNSQCQIKGMMYDTGYGYPAITLNGEQDIHGQLITIPKQDLVYFDKLQGYPQYYNRQLVDINIDGQIEQAFVYTMNNINKTFKIVQNGIW